MIARSNSNTAFGTFIRSINLGQQRLINEKGWKTGDRSENKDIEIACPSDFGDRALTVIAGRNRTGKTFLMRNAERAMRVHDAKLESERYDARLGGASGTVRVTPAQHTLPFASYLYLTNLSQVARQFATLPVSPSTRTPGSISIKKVVDARNAFLREQLLTAESFRTELGRSLNNDDFQDPAKLHTLLKGLGPDKLYRVNTSGVALIREFEKLCGGCLYLQIAPDRLTFKPVLRFGPGEIFEFGGEANGWSQGQKVAFLLIIALHYAKPSILLVDELENHMHPEFISRMCQLIRENVPQSIVSTHHPHLLFSDFVDRAWFFEIQNADDRAPLIDLPPTRIPIHITPPKRRIIDLNTDFERIAAAYSLFDSRDKQLLNLSMAAKSQASFGLLSALDSALTLKALPSSKSTHPDAQTVELAEVLRSFLTKLNTIRVFDYGAGLGRTFFELAKTGKIAAENVQWTFFEPNKDTALELDRRIAEVYKHGNPARPTIVQDVKSLSEKFDVILAVNLLHECTPKDIFRVFENCRRLLTPDGRLLIAEIYPLIEPERFGIGYTASDMADVADACGFSGVSQELAMRGGTLTAYTFIAHPSRLVTEEVASDAIVTRVWTAIQRRCMIEYGGAFERKTARSALKLASQLHVVASMCAYAQGIWRTLD